MFFFLVQSVDGMKVVCHELAQATSDPEGSAMDELVKDADRLVSCLANKVRWFSKLLPLFGEISPSVNFSPVILNRSQELLTSV